MLIVGAIAFAAAELLYGGRGPDSGVLQFVLYGLVGILGVRIWLTNHVDFGLPVNQMTAAIPLIIGIADFTWQPGSLIFTGISLGSIAALVVYHGMRLLGFRTNQNDQTQSPRVDVRDNDGESAK
jgi:xanthine/uracil permease